MTREENDGAWVCNQCGSAEFTGSVSEDDVEKMNCSRCGANEFHWVGDGQ